MALTIEQEAQQPTGTAGANGGHAGEEFPTPYLGRSVKIVGQHVNVDMNQSPHPKNQRGELGKPLFNWYRNTVSKDPSDPRLGTQPLRRSQTFSGQRDQPVEQR